MNEGLQVIKELHIYCVRKAVPYSGIPKSPYIDDFEWPDNKSILNAQLKA